MQKLISLFVVLICTISYSFSQSCENNPSLQQGVITPAPLTTGSGGTLSFTFMENLQSYTDDENNPLTIVVCLLNIEPTNGTTSIGGTYAGNFSWLYDPASNCIQGTQSQDIIGGSSGTITVDFDVVNPVNCPNNQLGFNANIQPAPCMNNFNDATDDAVSSYTCIDDSPQTCNNNPSLIQGSITPDPFTTETSGTLSFNYLENLQAYTDDENDPVNIVVCLLNIAPTNGTSSVGGSFASSFNWTYDAATNCFLGTQNQDIPAGGGGAITIDFDVVTSVACPTNQMGFNANIQPAACMNGTNDTTDDNISSYTCVQATSNECVNNPSLQQGDINPAPLIPGSSGTLSFTYFENLLDYTDDENNPVQLTVCMLNIEPVNGVSSIGGTFAGHFNWVYDPITNCMLGTQNQDILGGTGGSITILFDITNTVLCPDNQMGFNANLQPAACMNNSNQTTDDTESTYTCVFDCQLAVTFSNVVNTTCGTTDGQATANANQGTAPFTFEWDSATGNQTSATVNNLSAGNYTVTVTDADGCVATNLVTITGNGTNICTIINGDPNHPQANLDCDNGGIDNYTECQNGGDPYDPSDDVNCDFYPCAEAEAGNLDICAVLLNDPSNELGTLDCDDGGVDNLTECNNNGDPLDADDDCSSALASLDICSTINGNADHPLAYVDCDGGGVVNIIECMSGEDPSDFSDDCSTAMDENLSICGLLTHYGTLTPTDILADYDCDGGGIDNIIECANGGDPSDPTDDCAVIAEAGLDICALVATPGNIVDNLDCDGDGVTNATECTDSTNPSDPCDYEASSVTLSVTADQSDCVEICPDLSPVITVIPGNIQGVGSVDIAVEVFELNNVDTDGTPIIVRIPSDPRLTFTWDPTLTFVAFTTVKNSDWTYLGDNGIVHNVQYTGVIGGGQLAGFGFEATYDPQNTDGQTTISSSVIPFTGGDCEFLNNVDAERLVYFD